MNKKSISWHSDLSKNKNFEGVSKALKNLRRNTISINHMDYLIFLDDDEYPIATIKINDSIVWKDQEVNNTMKILKIQSQHG